MAFKKYVNFTELPKSFNLCGKLGNCVSPKTSDESVFCIVRQTRCVLLESATKPNGGLKPLISKRTLLQCILRLEGFHLSMPAYIHILDYTKVILDIEFQGEAHMISLKPW